MKKTFSILLIFTIILCGFKAFAASGDIAGNVYSTDIVTYMYYAPITSFNIGGKTCIDAEILNWHYGFDVYWYEDERRLDITDKGGRFVSGQAMSGEIVESTAAVPGEIVYNYYKTDIVTTLNGEKIESYNIGGRTVICAEAMRDFGYKVDWDEVNRTLTISKPSDFYKYETDYGTIKSMHNYKVVRKDNAFSNRGVTVTKDDKQYEIKTPSNKIFNDPGGITYIKLSDFVSILGGECAVEEVVIPSETTWANGITDTYDEYAYVFKINYDTSINLELTEYVAEDVKIEFVEGCGYIVDLMVDTIMLNGEEYELKAMYGGKEFNSVLIAVEGEIYLAAYNVAQILGYEFSW